MTLPGTQVIPRESPPASSADIDTGTLFAVGFAERGATDKPVLVRNLSQYEREFGDRSTGYVTAYDSADAFFRDGGSRLYFSRATGPNPTKATLTLLDDADANTVRIDAVAPGVWYAGLDIVVEEGVADGTFVITVLDSDDDVLEQSPELNDVTELVAWSLTSGYIRAVDLGEGTDPAVLAATDLAGGTDDKAAATDATWKAALDRFTADLGPGQVAMPGRTSGQAHADLFDHAGAKNRRALPDFDDTSNVGTLVAAVAAIRITDPARFGGCFGPWVVAEGVVRGTTRLIPGSAIVAALIARSEGLGNSPNVPAAGDNGISNVALDVTQHFPDEDRETLNDAGYNVLLLRNNAVKVYGYRTPVNPITEPDWLLFNNSRLAMAIIAEADEIAERFMFDQIDGRGLKIAEFNGSLVGMLIPYFDAGSLYGETFQDAAKVETGPQVNTTENLAQGILSAQIAIRMSPFAERVVIEITKVANTEVIA